MSTNETSRSMELLNKVYDRLDAVDINKLSMSELKDFLEVVQKGQFLESFGKIPYYGSGLCYSAPPTNESADARVTGME